MNDVSQLIRYRKRQDYYFQIVGAACTAVGVLTLAALLIKLSWDGLGQIVRFEFFHNWPILTDVGITFLIALGLAVPVAVSVAALTTDEHENSLLSDVLRILARFRAIAIGLVILLLLAHWLDLFGNRLVGGIVLGLLVTPRLISVSRDFVRQRPVRFGAALSALLLAGVVGLGAVAWAGLTHLLRLEFFLSNASYDASKAGILTAWVGTLGVMTVTFATAVPLGVAAAVYLEEYARKNVFTNLIEINISNLAGVPSISYGLMALWLFSHLLEWKSSIFVGGVTLALLILPIVIVATREALRSIPGSIREAAYAAGATKWQTIRYHLLPYSLGGIATGTIIAMSRAMGETAPLIVIGAAGYLTNLPPSPLQRHFPFVSFDWLNSPFTVLPMQMFYWTSEPGFESHAAATGLVLIVLTLSINAAAISVRYRVRQKLKW
ncbi:MAG TPA: phosphate ABC transporter permease PstA [Pirellulaceae bacterium]|jgi:phosphate transport system permease protein|nr:phosphate ABC transporter permease PstA [Pirellulaceae bacterium]